MCTGMHIHTLSPLYAQKQANTCNTHTSIIITWTSLMDMMTTNQVVCMLLTFTDGDED